MTKIPELIEANQLFTPALRTIQMLHASHLFTYLKSRKDTNLEGCGEQVLGHMQKFRSCLKENMGLYYGILRPVLNQLFRYPDIEEKAAISGFYDGQRHQLVANIRATVMELEAQDDLMFYLDSMHHVVIHPVETEEVKDGAESS